MTAVSKRSGAVHADGRVRGEEVHAGARADEERARGGRQGLTSERERKGTCAANFMEEYMEQFIQKSEECEETFAQASEGAKNEREEDSARQSENLEAVVSQLQDQYLREGGLPKNHSRRTFGFSR